MQFLNNYSNRELNIWAELILDIIVSIYFFPKIFPLIIDGQLYSDALVGIIATSIIISIFYSVFVFGAINTLTKREEKDERDVVLTKIPVITATVKLVGIVLGVETLVQLDFGPEGLVRPDIDVV